MSEATTVRPRSHNPFRPLRLRNFRLFIFGQLVSVTGTWMQFMAQDWLVLKVTHSGLAVGITTALQFLPILVLGLWGGRFVDRRRKRDILLVTQTLAGLLALGLGVSVLSGVVTVWIVYLFAFLAGCVTVVDNPCRQSFVSEMVGPADVSSAVGVNSAVMMSGRILGPAMAGIMIAGVGIGWAFMANGLSYGAVIVALLLMRPGELFLARRSQARQDVTVRDGLRYVWRTRELRTTLVLLVFVAVLGLNFRVVLPLLTQFTFHKGAGVYSLLTSVMAVGSLTGALVAASLHRPTGRLMVLAAMAFGMLSVTVALMPTVDATAMALLPMGIASLIYMTMSNSLVQLTAEPEMRGRVMALFSMIFLGSNPIGAPIVGWVSDTWGPRVAIGFGGAASLLAAAVVAVFVLRRGWRDPVVATPAGVPPAGEPALAEAAA